MDSTKTHALACSRTAWFRSGGGSEKREEADFEFREVGARLAAGRSLHVDGVEAGSAILKYRDDPESQCAQPHDGRLHYTLTCKAGMARMRQHRASAATLTNLLKQNVAQVDKDRPAPDDKGEEVVKEAILDLAAKKVAVCP